jgi:hypothetical protein
VRGACVFFPRHPFRFHPGATLAPPATTSLPLTTTPLPSSPLISSPPLLVSHSSLLRFHSCLFASLSKQKQAPPRGDESGAPGGGQPPQVDARGDAGGHHRAGHDVAGLALLTLFCSHVILRQFIFCSQYLMTASQYGLCTNLTPGSECNPYAVEGRRARGGTAVTNGMQLLPIAWNAA